MLVDHEEVVRLVQDTQPLQVVVGRFILHPVQQQLQVLGQLSWKNITAVRMTQQIFPFVIISEFRIVYIGISRFGLLS
jgi:hypothetical protein